MTNWLEWLFGLTPLGVFDVSLKEGESVEVTDDTKRAERSLRGLAVLGGVVAAPLGYAAYLHASKSKKKRNKLTPSEQRMGVALENASMQTADIVKTAIVSPYIAFPLAYLGVQMLKDIPAATTKIVKHPAVAEVGYWYQPPKLPEPPNYSTDPTSPYYFDPWPPKEWVVTTPAKDAWDETIAYPAGFITQGLGDAIQGLMTLSAAGPMIQGVTGMIGSAFKK